MGTHGYPFVYRRGNLLLALNATERPASLPFSIGTPLFLHGTAQGHTLGAQSFVVWEE